MKGYFKGWYFKQQTKEKTVAIIPAMHVNEKGIWSCSIQVITDDGVWCANYPYLSYHEDRNPLQVVIGENYFSQQGITLHIHQKDLTVSGNLTFENHRPLKYDIMGPFQFVPFMECRHSVFSMAHSVNGTLTINGQTFNFNNEIGYMEGDRGRSFPKQYVWTQCNFGNHSLMLSVADIPFLGGNFTGVIAAILYLNQEFRIATYLGAKPVLIQNGNVVVKQGNFTLIAKLIEKKEQSLHAPICGNMGRFIRESIACKAHYTLQIGEKTLFSFATDKAGFEYEYDQ